MLRFVFVVFLMMFIVTGQVFAHGAKDPTAALILALIIPGGGQIYNEQPEKALIPIGGLAAGIAGYSSHNWDDSMRNLGMLVGVATWVYSVLDAPMTADKINQRSRFGHMLEFNKEEIVLGVDPIVSRNSLGTTLSLRF